jgi:hypothetical protein
MPEMPEFYDSDHPETIRARTEERERVLKARAQLHPAAQVATVIMEGLGNFASGLGCLLVIVVVIVATIILLNPSILGTIQR